MRHPDAVRPAPPARELLTLSAAVGLLAWAGAAPAQDLNLLHRPSQVEPLLRSAPFEIQTWRGARYPDDRTRQATLAFEDGTRIQVKWLPAPRGGGTFNNRPRYELAAYELQKLFLDEGEYVVPPTACRCVDLARYRERDARAGPTFEGTSCALVTLQYWLWSVTDEEVFDEDRFDEDTAYARHLANANILTYLVEHKDANVGNFLVSTAPSSPRVFVVDNSVAFGSRPSNRGTDWRRLRVERVPAATVERLRGLTLRDLRSALAVLAQFERRGGVLEAAEPAAPLDPGDGIRQQDGVLQLGLTDGEIEDVWDRIRDLLEEVDEGEVATF